jgi:hypothetical protein
VSVGALEHPTSTPRTVAHKATMRVMCLLLEALEDTGLMMLKV